MTVIYWHGSQFDSVFSKYVQMQKLENKIDELLGLVKQQKLLAKNIFTLKEAAEYLKVSESQIYKLTHNRIIPHHKPTGKLIYFHKTDLDNFRLSNRVKSDQELQDLADKHRK